MSVDAHKPNPGPIRWPPASDLATRRPESASLYTYLLDADDDLAQEFDVRMRVAARQVTTVRVLDADVGACDLEPWFQAAGRGPGLLILDGLIAFETRVGNRTASELTGAGDLLQPPCPRDEELVKQRDAWRALWPTRFALLDHEFSERVRPWPQIGLALLRRAGRRIADADALRAIACQPRLEFRLVLLLWHLATRWGRVEPGGIRLTLPLTHRLLGQLVAAERPSVSHALGRLAQSGLVTGSAGDLHLHGTLDHHLEALTERTGSLAERSSQARPSRRRRIA
jgi:CRP/FNR family cyclic AMP-dependent transcriptional regulator